MILKGIDKTAQHFRDNPTKAEYALREKLDLWKIPYRFQFVVQPFIADFFLPKRQMIVEVDDSGHERRKFKDAKRTKFLNERGYSVARIKNNDIYGLTLKGFLAIVGDAFGDTPTKDSPLTFKGRNKYSISDLL